MYYTCGVNFQRAFYTHKLYFHIKSHQLASTHTRTAQIEKKKHKMFSHALIIFISWHLHINYHERIYEFMMYGIL